MKQLFSQSHFDSQGNQYYEWYLGIDENKDEVKQLKTLKKLIDLHLYYKLDKIITLDFNSDTINEEV